MDGFQHLDTGWQEKMTLITDGIEYDVPTPTRVKTISPNAVFTARVR